MIVFHLPRFLLLHFGASGGAILSLFFLRKEKEQPKKEKRSPLYTAKEDSRLRVERTSRLSFRLPLNGENRNEWFFAPFDFTHETLFLKDLRWIP